MPARSGLEVGMKKAALWRKVTLRVNRNVFLFSLACIAFAIFPPRATGQSLKPELVWERRYDKNIREVGFDCECFKRSNRIARCVKWIELEGEGVLLMGSKRWKQGNRLRAIGYPHTPITSSGGQCFVALYKNRAQHSEENPLSYVAFDWDGNRLWEMKSELVQMVVWDDGCSMYWDPSAGRGEQLTFLDKQGRKVGFHRFSEPQRILMPTTDRSDNYYAVASSNSAIHVFDRTGNLVWKRNDIEKSYPDQSGEVVRYYPRSLAVSDKGEVILWLYGEEHGARGLVYGADEELRDTIVFRNTGPAVCKSSGRLMFGNVTRSLSQPWRFFCYDMDKKLMRFALEETDTAFARADANLSRQEVAVLVSDEQGGNMQIRVYGFDGNLKCRIDVESPERGWPWFKLLDGAVFLAEGKSLKLYRFVSATGLGSW
jgi:hypothetical protein